MSSYEPQSSQRKGQIPRLATRVRDNQDNWILRQVAQLVGMASG
jgi:hypothetical protein